MFDKILDKLSSDKTKRVEKEVIASATQRYAPNTKIAYKPELVSTLQKEHTQLQSLFWKTLTSAHNHKDDVTRRLLTRFKDLFVDHVLKESTSLYLYLRHTAEEPNSEHTLKTIKADMDVIGRKIKRFLDESINEDSSLDEHFIAEFKRIGIALNERIEMEEEFVYPRYQPN
jgi:hemerythrin